MSLATAKERARKGEDPDYNKLIKTWIEQAESGVAERNYSKFISQEWSPRMKKYNALLEKIKQLEQKKVSKDEVKDLKREAQNIRNELRRISPDKIELAKRRNYPDEPWILENIDWA
jgi:hypothetical protein